MIYAQTAVAVAWAVPLWWFLVRPHWPWDWTGKRKAIKFKSRDRDFD